MEFFDDYGQWCIILTKDEKNIFLTSDKKKKYEFEKSTGR